MKTRAILTRILSCSLGLTLIAPVKVSAVPPTPAESEFVDIKKIDPTILVDLRYAGPNNFMHRPIYPPGMPALVRASVADRLLVAQKYLSERGYGLKIWDAYRPQSAQQQLWEAIRNGSYVANPKDGLGSNHTRGVAVDATLVDRSGQEMPMPTDFDNFSPAAMLTYQGNNGVILTNLKLLQKAMAHGGFYGLRTEWWHFCAPDYGAYPPVPELRWGSPAPETAL